MKKTALMITLLTIISKVMGFFREIILSYFYGASNVSDAYLISLTIPGVIFAFIGTGISTSYIPIYNDMIKKGLYSETNKFTNSIINIILLFSMIIVIIILFFTDNIVKIFAFGFKGETLILAKSFTKISIFGIFFSGLVYIFTSHLHIKNNFIVPILVGIPFNLCIIISIILSKKLNILILSIGSILALVIQVFILIVFSYKNGYKYLYIIDRKNKYLKKIIYLSLPVIIGVSVNQINVLVDRTIASNISIGGISSLNYANRLNTFTQEVLVLPLITVMYPVISRLSIENNIDNLKKIMFETIKYIILLIVPITVLTMVFSKEIIILLFDRGAFDKNALDMTSFSLFFYSIGMIGFGLREVVSRVFYSFQDTKTPMINATMSMIMNIILNIILSSFLGIGGLALATSISAIVCTMLLFNSLNKKIDLSGIKSIYILFIKILTVSIFMGVFCKFIFLILSLYIFKNISLIFSMFIGIILYLIVVYLMKVDEINNIINYARLKIKNL